MNHNTTISLPVASDLSAAVPYSAIKLTPTGIALAVPGDLAIGSMITPNLAPQIANQSAVGMAADVFLYNANGVHFVPIGDNAAYSMGDTLQLGGAAAGQVIHNNGGPFIGIVLYGCPANSLGAIIRMIAAIGVQAAMILLMLFLFGMSAHAQQPAIQLTGTGVPPNLPVADPGVTYVATGSSNSGYEWYKVNQTTLILSGSASTGTVYAPGNSLNLVISGTDYPLGSGTTTLTSESGTGTMFTTASPWFGTSAIYSGTSFQVIGANLATTTGSATLSGTGWWLVAPIKTTGTSVVSVAQ